MATPLEQHADLVLKTLGDFHQMPGASKAGRDALKGDELAVATGLDVGDLNDVVDLLEHDGYVKIMRALGTAPFNFLCVSLTPQGRLAYQKQIQLSTMSKEVNVQKDPKNVFVVHGRNTTARDALFDFLRSVGLNPMEWEEARRLTGRPSPYIGEILDAAFTKAQAIVVLFTGDDEARLRESFRGNSEPLHEIELTPQARPNVLFEAGMALGRHPDRTILIEIGNLRPFTDIAGIHTIRITSGSAGERHALVDRLQDAKCEVTTQGRRDWLERDYFGPIFKLDPQ